MLVALAACAPRSSSPPSPFVKRSGNGLIDVGGTPETAATMPSRKAVEEAVREAQRTRQSWPAAPLPVVEQTDRVLQGALAALQAGHSAAAHLRVAAEYLRVGVWDRAYDHYSEALQINPRSASALDGRARLLRDAGLLGLALADAHRATYFAPASAEASNTLGTILERQGLCREALGMYRRAAQLKPEAGWAAANAERMATKCP